MPIRPVTLPSAIQGQTNGAVDANLLRPVQKNQTALVWYMAELPARSMRAFHAAAAAEGLFLTSSGRGRTLSQQWGIFGGNQARYKAVSLAEYNAAPSGNRKFWGAADYTTPAGQRAPGRVSVANTLNVTIPNSSYWIKVTLPSGVYPATAAVPGTSNHGFWCADDMAKVDPTGVKPYLSFNIADLQILYRLGPVYGFWWETRSENWHVHWGNGDQLTAATIAFEGGVPVPPTPNPPTPSPGPVDPDYDDDEMPIVTNAEQLFNAKPLEGKFVVRDDGTIRMLDLPEWHARGSKMGYALTNADIGVLWKE